MLNSGKVKNELACAQQNADLLKKISLMGTEWRTFTGVKFNNN